MECRAVAGVVATVFPCGPFALGSLECKYALPLKRGVQIKVQSLCAPSDSELQTFSHVVASRSLGCIRALTKADQDQSQQARSAASLVVVWVLQSRPQNAKEKCRKAPCMRVLSRGLSTKGGHLVVMQQRSLGTWRLGEVLLYSCLVSSRRLYCQGWSRTWAIRTAREARPCYHCGGLQRRPFVDAAPLVLWCLCCGDPHDSHPSSCNHPP